MIIACSSYPWTASNYLFHYQRSYAYPQPLLNVTIFQAKWEQLVVIGKNFCHGSCCDSTFCHHWKAEIGCRWLFYSVIFITGVVGAIVTWNFPLALLAWKVCPALAMGNTVVFKPATNTSLSALLFAEICAEAG